MFASELAGVTPDMMCLSKGITGGFLPMGATVVTERIFEAFSGGDPARTFWHGHSYTGNPIACAAAVANLEIFRTEPVFDRIAGIAAIHSERLPAFSKRAAVGDVRTIGTMAAIELRAADAGYLSELRPKLYEYFLKRDILLRPLGNVIYILPPYCIEAGDLHRIYDVIEEAIDAVA
jgi:adenosylmethionine-8-amino-7-oxononanoate aminotransferase